MAVVQDVATPWAQGCARAVLFVPLIVISDSDLLCIYALHNISICLSSHQDIQSTLNMAYNVPL